MWVKGDIYKMTEQTKKLCKSMPQLAKLLEEFDGKGHKWVIVSWRDAQPWRVTLKEITPLPVVQIGSSTRPNLFTSRTDALRRSEEACHSVTYRTQDEHWGVWKWNDEQGDYYRSALPAAAFKAE